MKDTWSYDKDKRFDKKGKRWHFVYRSFHGTGTPYEERPYEVYFRDDDKTEFGLLRFERLKDNPYRDYLTVITKIMNNDAFRLTLLSPNTAEIWQKSWK
jgi:hypothetical protein